VSTPKLTERSCDIPQTITVIPRAVMEEQARRRFAMCCATLPTSR
jgi:outer membrane receptor for monomeric catechols